MLSAHGELLRLHDAYREAAAAGLVKAGAPDAGRDGGAPGAGGNGGGSAAVRLRGQGDVPGRVAARAPAMPASVTIVWGDGTVTTVHPPEGS